ncbi:ABC transporter substrate-binding protein [Streptomyces kunmingensis]|uniref:ABC transporter substrate-binding protein n=1 Tax=Streptomyces kunmingensis TaxID=68225 RepID=A0ABU6CNX5_9ACTN|nr:ABC transporter substrate-binding protein [Streptomyces kunmingensis]MEB3966418.1 ABC transporter substrate-binding protein [Streptomyces kunmingensis]
MSRTRRTFTALAAVALLAATAACGSGSDSGTSGSRSPTNAAGETTVKLGVIPILDVAPIYLGQKKGFYQKHGLRLALTTAQGGAAIVPAVVSGQFQFGFSNAMSLMIAQSNGVPVEGVVNGVNSTGKPGADFGAVVVKKGSSLKTAKDLEGKKVAVNTLKNINDTTVRESVRKAGGDPSEVDFVELAFDQMPAALAGGQIDAAQVVEPALATVKAQGGRVIASNFTDTAPNLTVAMFFTSATYAKNHPDIVEKFTAATKESLAYADQHPDEVRQILTTYTKIPAATLDSLVLPRWPTTADRSSLEKLAELGEQDGQFRKAPDLDALLP